MKCTTFFNFKGIKDKNKIFFITHKIPQEERKESPTLHTPSEQLSFCIKRPVIIQNNIASTLSVSNMSSVVSWLAQEGSDRSLSV